MTNLLTTLDTLKRPRLLINAARIGTSTYRREMHLPRLLGEEHPPEPATALAQLIGLEAEINAARTARLAEYSVARHLDVLIAIMGEARLVREALAAPPLASPV